MREFNPIRDKRLYEVRMKLHKSNLDIGCSHYRITNESITVDTRPETKPHMISTITNLPLKDDSFDSITALEILEHLHRNQLTQAISEIKRVLKHQGQLVVSIPNSTPFMILPQQLAWFIREHTTQSTYHNNRHTHTHIGLITPNQLIDLLIRYHFTIIDCRRIMLYDYMVVGINDKRIN